MMKILKVAALGLMLAAPVEAEKWDDGLAAYYAGDFATALENWRPLAEQGNAWAQNWLGIMYDSGRGVPQDYVSAHMWLSLGAQNGSNPSVIFLRGLVEKMTPADISEAERRARVCMESNYQVCNSAISCPLNRTEVTYVQRRLSRLGFFDGAIDGILGPETRAAFAQAKSTIAPLANSIPECFSSVELEAISQVVLEAMALDIGLACNVGPYSESAPNSTQCEDSASTALSEVDLRQEAAQLRSLVRVLEGDLASKQREIDALGGPLDTLASEDAVAIVDTQEVASLREQIEGLNGALVDLQAQNAALEARTVQSQSSSNSSTGEYLVEASAHARTRAALEQALVNLNAANATLAELQASRTSLMAELAERNADLNEALPVLENRTAQLAAANTVLTELQQAKQTLAAQLEVTLEAYRSEQANSQILAVSLAETGQRLDGLNQTLAEFRADRDQNYVERQLLLDKVSQIDALNSTLVDKDAQMRRIEASNAAFFAWCQDDIDCRSAFGLR